MWYRRKRNNCVTLVHTLYMTSRKKCNNGGMFRWIMDVSWCYYPHAVMSVNLLYFIACHITLAFCNFMNQLLQHFSCTYRPSPRNAAELLLPHGSAQGKRSIPVLHIYALYSGCLWWLKSQPGAGLSSASSHFEPGVCHFLCGSNWAVSEVEFERMLEGCPVAKWCA